MGTKTMLLTVLSLLFLSALTLAADYRCEYKNQGQVDCSDANATETFCYRAGPGQIENNPATVVLCTNNTDTGEGSIICQLSNYTGPEDSLSCSNMPYLISGPANISADPSTGTVTNPSAENGSGTTSGNSGGGGGTGGSQGNPQESRLLTVSVQNAQNGEEITLRALCNWNFGCTIMVDGNDFAQTTQSSGFREFKIKISGAGEHSVKLYYNGSVRSLVAEKKVTVTAAREGETIGKELKGENQSPENENKDYNDTNSVPRPQDLTGIKHALYKLGFVGNGVVNVVDRGENPPAHYMVTVSGGVVTSVENGQAEKPKYTIEVSSQASSAIRNSNDPYNEAIVQFRGGEVKVIAHGFFEQLQLFFFSIFSGFFG